MEEYEAKAKEIGQEHGTNAGSWVVDGNTSAVELRSLRDAIDGGLLFDKLNPSAPLSGEWADGYTTDQLARDCGLVEDELSGEWSETYNELATAYEDAYWQAFEAEVERSIRAMLPEEETR